MGSHADSAGVQDDIAGSDLGEIALRDKFRDRSEVLVDVIDQGLSELRIEVGDVDLACAVVSQNRAHRAACTAGTEAEEHALARLDPALFRNGSVESGAVSIVALQLSFRSLDNSVAGAHLFAQRIQLIKILQDLDLVRLRYREPCEVHVTKSVDDVAEVLVAGLSVEIEHVEPCGLVTLILHSGSKGLAKRISEQRDEFGIDIDIHKRNLPPLIFFQLHIPAGIPVKSPLRTKNEITRFRWP